MTDSVHEAWTRELDRLEAGLLLAEHVATGTEGDQPPTAWEPPAMPGPIPGSLVERATGLLDRLEAARESVARSLTDVQAQLGFANRVGDIAPAAAERRPVYLDVSC